jgi:hypothetical protein
MIRTSQFLRVLFLFDGKAVGEVPLELEAGERAMSSGV